MADVLALPDPDDDDDREEEQEEDEEQSPELGQNPAVPTPAHRRTTVEVLEMGRQMWEEYAGGLNQRQIADLHGVSTNVVHNCLSRFARQYKRKDIERARRTDLDRIEALMEAQWHAAITTGNKDKVKLVLVMIQLRARILGYEAPRRIEHSGEVQAGVTPELAEILRIRQEKNQAIRGELERVGAEILDAEVVVEDDDDHHDD